MSKPSRLELVTGLLRGESRVLCIFPAQMLKYEEVATNHATDRPVINRSTAPCLPVHRTSTCTLPGLHSATLLPTTCTEQVVVTNRFPPQARRPEKPRRLLSRRQAERRYFWRSGSYSEEKCFPWLVKVAQTECGNRLKKPAFHSLFHYSF